MRLINSKYFLLLISCCLLFIANSYAFSKPNFKYLTNKNGLSNNHITSVLEDKKGFLWFSTSYGLNKWDGYEIEIFKHEFDHLNSISSNFILCLEEDQQDNLWIGTNLSGVVRYNYREKRFYRFSSDFNKERSVPSVYVRKIFADITNTVWIATDHGLCRYVPETKDFERIRFGATISPERVYNIHQLKNGELVFQTEFGLFLYNPTERIFRKMEFPIYQAMPRLLTNNFPLCFTENNQLFIGTESGLIRYNFNNKSYSLYRHSSTNVNSISSNIISVIKQDSHNNIWIGTRDGGLNRYRNVTDDFEVYSSGALNGKNLSNNIITAIYEDSYQNIWVGTQEGGLTYFSLKESIFCHFQNQPTDKSTLLHNKVSAFVQDGAGNIWVGTGDGGLNRLNQLSGTFDRFQLNSDAVSPSLLGICSQDDKLYVVGWGCGLNQFDTKRFQFSPVTAKSSTGPERAPQNLKGIGSDKDGNIWLASHSLDGIYVYSPIENRFYNSKNPGKFDPMILSVSWAVSMKQDSKGRIWVVSYSGLFMYNGTYHRYRSTLEDTLSLSSNYIYSLFESSDSSIWIGNSNGLDKLIDVNGEIRFERYAPKYNLPDNVKDIQEDDAGNLWLSTNQGLTKFNPKTHYCRDYQFNSGLPVQEFFERSSLKAANGELFFGSTNNGFVKFNPEKINLDNKAPKLFFTDLQIFNESQQPGAPNSPLEFSITETDTLVLNHNQSVISFEYVAIDFQKLDQTDFAYILEGFNDKWNFVGKKRYAHFTNLSPGEYTLRVRTANGKQLIDGSEAVLFIVIKPPLWRTKWAYSIYLIIILFSFFLYQHSLFYREKLRIELKLEKMEIKNVRENNLMKLRFFTNISHEFRSPLTLIKAPLEKLLSSDSLLSEKERRYHYELIMNSTKKLLDMVNQLMDYRKLEAGSLVLEPSMGDIVTFCRKTWDNFSYLAAEKQITYRFHSEMKTLHIAFDADKLDKALSNLLSNAFKCTSSGGLIELQVQYANTSASFNEPESVEISVKDTGIGIPEKDLDFIFDRFFMVSSGSNQPIQGSGIGLTLAKEMIELHKGKISVQSKEGQGSEFIIHLPIEFHLMPVDSKTKTTKSIIDEFVVEDAVNALEALAGNDVPSLLIVEDDNELLSFLEHELGSNYKIITAKNGEEGLQKANAELPNLILSDVMMPKMSGIELCKNIKKDEQTSHIPVILVTARYAQDKEIEGLESGADAYVLKPFNLKVLQLQIANLLSSRRELIEKFRNGTSLFFDEPGVETKDQRLMQNIIDLIIENISNDKINATFIADKLHISRSLLYIKIEALSGQTVNEFIRNIRLKKAIHLIEKTNMTFTEVAYATGFTSQSYFSRSFTKQFGCSPTEYQKSKGV